MANGSTCYFPDGSISLHDLPCHSSSTGDGASACCGDTDVCLSNNLCLNQGGAELISRGSCTDETWQSAECGQYCLDVVPDGGATIFPFGILDDQFLFCCSQSDPFNNTCLIPTKGSSKPFSVNAGRVIFNRTSGSTSPNNTNTETVTVTVTAAATITATASSAALASPFNCPSSSSSKEVAIGTGVGVPLGLAFLIALALLYIQRGRMQKLTKDVRTWEDKYHDSINTKTSKLNGTEYQSPHQLEGWTPNELDGQGASSGRPDEIDGRQILQMEDKTR